MALVGVAVWALLQEPDELLAKILILTGLIGGTALFVSILIDRLKTYKTDRYRRVQK